MSDARTRQAIESSDDWDVFTGKSGTLPRPARGIRLTVYSGSGSTSMSVRRDGHEASKPTGELGLMIFEPMQGLTEIEAVGPGVSQYRVYY